MDKKVFFSHAEERNPFLIYEHMLEEAPIYFDEANHVWGVYKYDDCCGILTATKATVPGIQKTGDVAVDAVVGGLVRLANGSDHTERREVGQRMLSAWRYPEDSAEIIGEIINKEKIGVPFDWVTQAGATAPGQLLLNGFGLDHKVVSEIIAVVPGLVKLMNPLKSGDDIKSIRVSLNVIQKHSKFIRDIFRPATQHEYQLLISSFVGLLIQIYDAGIGTFCNLLMHFNDSGPSQIEQNINGFVNETFRYSPPFHNTRRVAADTIEVNKTMIAAGETIIIFVAAANRDPEIFANPSQFSVDRTNSQDALTFGVGVHACIARDFSHRMGVDLVHFLLSNNRELQLIDNVIQFQPKVNARIPARLLVRANVITRS